MQPHSSAVSDGFEIALLKSLERRGPSERTRRRRVRAAPAQAGRRATAQACAEDCFGADFGPPFPPAVANRLLFFSALAAAIERPTIGPWLQECAVQRPSHRRGVSGGGLDGPGWHQRLDRAPQLRVAPHIQRVHVEGKPRFKSFPR